jgi:uncharacterized protein YndB with AHSA1/START domain
VQEVDAHAHSAAPPERVFALLADAHSWPRWGPFDSAEVVEGEPGLGEVRSLTTGRVVNRERVVTFDPPRQFSYVLEAGLPLRDYRADVTLVAAGDGGTDIRWHSRFQGKYPLVGALVRPRLSKFIAQAVEALARGAEGPGA